MYKTNSKSSDPLNYKWVILVMGIIVTLGSLGFSRFGFSMILPGMKTGLQLTDTQTGLLVTASLAGYLIMSITCGFLVTKFSFRIVITLFLSISGGAAFLLGISRSFPAAMAACVLLGIGSAGSNIPMVSLLALWYPKKRRGMAVGLSTSGASLGLLLTGLIIPLFYRTIGAGEGWRYSWYSLACFILIIALMGGIFLKNSPETGTADSARTEPERTVGLRHIYRSGILWHLSLVYAFFGLSYIVYASFFASYLVAELELSINRAGNLWSAIGIISIVSGFLWGVVSDRAGRKSALALVFLLQCLCYGIFGLWKAVPGILLSALFFSLTSWSIPAIMAASVGDLFKSRSAPLAFGFVTLFFGIGQAAGPVIAGAIADGTGSYSNAFVLAAAFALAGCIGSLMLRREFRPVQ